MNIKNFFGGFVEVASFWRGNHAADLIRRINCGELTHAQGDALMAEYDAQQAKEATAA